jgi:hypothetical protein
MNKLHPECHSAFKTLKQLGFLVSIDNSNSERTDDEPWLMIKINPEHEHAVVEHNMHKFESTHKQIITNVLGRLSSFSWNNDCESNMHIKLYRI